MQWCLVIVAECCLMYSGFAVKFNIMLKRQLYFGPTGLCEILKSSHSLADEGKKSANASIENYPRSICFHQDSDLLSLKNTDLHLA